MINKNGELRITDFIKYIDTKISLNELEYIDLNSGEIHRELGGYPGKKHSMPSCCEAMRSMMTKQDYILKQPLKGNGASLTIRYYKR